LCSSCESEYIANSEACQEATFMNQLLEELFGVPMRAMVYGDNQGALLRKNCQVSQCTTQTDISQNLFRELQKQKKVVGEYVQSENNMPDGATKNLPEKLFCYSHHETQNCHKSD